MATAPESTYGARSRQNDSRNLPADVVRRALDGNEDAVAAVVARMEPFIQSAIRRVGASAPQAKDLAQDARLAVLEALPDYSIDSGYPLETFLYRRVRGSVFDSASQYFAGFAVDSSTTKRYLRSLRDTSSDLEAREYARKEFGMLPATWDRTHAALSGVWSCEDAFNELTVDDFQHTFTDALAVREAAARLPERDFHVITYAYGLDGGPRLTDREIGDVLDIDRSRVTRIRARATKTLREVLA